MQIIKEEIKSAEKKGRRFPWIILTILLLIIGFIAFIAIATYQGCMKRPYRAKTVADIAPLKNLTHKRDGFIALINPINPTQKDE